MTLPSANAEEIRNYPLIQNGTLAINSNAQGEVAPGTIIKVSIKRPEIDYTACVPNAPSASTLIKVEGAPESFFSIEKGEITKRFIGSKLSFVDNKGIYFDSANSVELYGKKPSQVNHESIDYEFVAQNVNVNLAEGFEFSFSTSNWPMGEYKLRGFWNDGCRGAFSSKNILFSIGGVNSTTVTCDVPTKATVGIPVRISCKSSLDLINVKYQLIDSSLGISSKIYSGTANGAFFTTDDIYLPRSGLYVLRIISDGIVDKLEAFSYALNSILVAPGTTRFSCEADKSTAVSSLIRIECESSLNLPSTDLLIQYRSNGKWITIGNLGERIEGNSFATYFSPSKVGKFTYRIISDETPSITYKFSSNPFTVSITKAIPVKSSAKSQSQNSGGRYIRSCYSQQIQNPNYNPSDPSVNNRLSNGGPYLTTQVCKTIYVKK